MISSSLTLNQRKLGIVLLILVLTDCINLVIRILAVLLFIGQLALDCGSVLGCSCVSDDVKLLG